MMAMIFLTSARTGGLFLCRRSGSRRKLASYHRHPKRSLSSTAASASASSDDAPPPSTISPINTSLALSVHFLCPELGMKEHEILSRATAFLLQVDPPESLNEYNPSSIDDKSQYNAKGYAQKSAFPHLKENMELRKKLLLKQEYKYDPASGPARFPHELNWLEFCPTAFRPSVHVVASSHVISPWLWPKYYGQDWLRVVTQEHVRYSLEVWGNKTSAGEEARAIDNDGKDTIGHDGKLKGMYAPLAKFALNPYPIHHPSEMDIAIIHLKDEDAALPQMKKMGITPLHLPSMHQLETSNDPVFEPGEKVLFQGFEVYEANMADHETLVNDKSNKSDAEDDTRIFHPYSSLGTLAMASPDRFLAQTKAGSLPEGLCGGPVIQLPCDVGESGKRSIRTPLMIRGVVEGIVPANHENKQLAGLASFLPTYRVREFIDFAERFILEQIIENGLFKKVVAMKEKKDQRDRTYGTEKGGNVHELNVNDNDDSDDEDNNDAPDNPSAPADIEGISEESDTPQIDREFQEIVASLRENHTPQEVDAILATVEREREEVIKIMEKDGGDLDDVIAAVRKKTYDDKNQILQEIEMELMGQRKNFGEAESSSKSKDGTIP